MFKLPKRALLAVPALALLLATAACSGGGKAPETASSQGGGGQTATTPRLKIAMVSHAPPGDAFFDTIIKGAKDAAAKDNVDFQYSGDGDVTQQATLVQAAIDAKVDGIAVSIPRPTPRVILRRPRRSSCTTPVTATGSRLVPSRSTASPRCSLGRWPASS